MHKKTMIRECERKEKKDREKPPIAQIDVV